MKTKEVAERYNVARITVIKWAVKNGIKREEGVHGILEYKFTEADCRRFEKRPNPGKPRKSNQ